MSNKFSFSVWAKGVCHKMNVESFGKRHRKFKDHSIT